MWVSVSPGKTIEYGRSIRQESVTRWPIFATDIAAALRAYGDDSLTDQVKLRVVHVCGCEDDVCQSVDTAPRPIGAYGKGHPTLCLDPPRAGYLNLEVVDDVMVDVEVLHRSPPVLIRVQVSEQRMAPRFVAPDRPHVRMPRSGTGGGDEHAGGLHAGSMADRASNRASWVRSLLRGGRTGQ
jgi:hypothetical protein